jgi:hypothetical protein
MIKESTTRREIVLKGLAAAVALGVFIPESAEAAKDKTLKGRRWQDGYAVLGLALSDDKFLEELLKAPRLALRRVKLRPTPQQMEKILAIKPDQFRKVAAGWDELTNSASSFFSGW